MITIWHNPRCSKSRQTLDLLIKAGHDPAIRRYLDAPPTEEELRAAQAALGVPAIQMMRPNEPAFKSMGLSKTDDDGSLIAAMAKEPRLIERPIVFKGTKTAIGRPPEAVLDIL